MFVHIKAVLYSAKDMDPVKPFIPVDKNAAAIAAPAPEVKQLRKDGKDIF